MNKNIPCICSVGADDDMACACACSLPGCRECDYLSPSERDGTDYGPTRTERIVYTSFVAGAMILFFIGLAFGPH
ncbi:MAG: hypothetical protein KGS72_18415 [Cyanobacteria bacterium REEB67]|nr:hypothetical protein [Cyanobacteria bacterium REEB67]